MNTAAFFIVFGIALGLVSGCSRQSDSLIATIPCRGLVTDVCNFEDRWIVAEQDVVEREFRAAVIDESHRNYREVPIQAASVRVDDKMLLVATDDAILMYDSIKSLQELHASKESPLEGNGIPGIGPIHVPASGEWIVPAWVEFSFGESNWGPAWEITSSTSLGTVLGELVHQHPNEVFHSIAGSAGSSSFAVACVSNPRDMLLRVTFFDLSGETNIVKDLTDPAAVAVSSDGKYFAVLDKLTFSLFESSTKRRLWSLPTNPNGVKDGRGERLRVSDRIIDFSPSGNHVAVVFASSCFVFSTETGNELFSQRVHATAVAFSSDGKRIGIGCVQPERLEVHAVANRE